MEEVVNLLETYRGRDKVIRLCSYCAMLLAGKAENSRLLKISFALSNCRVVLRLFDDIPMLAYTLRYGKESKDEDWLTKKLGLANNITAHLYYVIEKIAWLSDTRVLTGSPSSSWWTRATYLWIFSLSAEIIQALMKLKKSQDTRSKLKNSSTVYQGKTFSEDMQIKLHRLSQEDLFHILIIVQNFTDLLCAINWLPRGILWSGKLSHTKVGFLGVISSVIRLYHVYIQNSKKTKRQSSRSTH